MKFLSFPYELSTFLIFCLIYPSCGEEKKAPKNKQKEWQRDGETEIESESQKPTGSVVVSRIKLLRLI